MPAPVVSVISQHEVRADEAPSYLGPRFELGPLDQQVFPFVPIDAVYIYHRPAKTPADEFMPPKALRQSLTKLLAHYPHLTGRFQRNAVSGTFEIGRLGQGITFLEAQCELRLAEVAACSRSGRIIVGNLPAHGDALMPPFDASIEGVCRDSILAVQHTRFACGGAALGIRLHHMVCDAGGFFNFVRDWVTVHRSSSLSSPPDLAYFLSGPDALSAEERATALKYEQSFWCVEAEQHTAAAQSSATPDIPPPDVAPIVGQTLHFSSDDLVSIKRQATNPCGEGWVSAFEAVSAYLCQMTYKARLQVLEKEGVSSASAAAQLCRGFWGSIDMRDPSRLNLGRRYFGNASFPVLTRMQHATLAEGQLWQVAEVIHKLVRSADPLHMEKVTKWFAAQPDKGRVKVDFNFGKGNFTVSQWSKHDMYRGAEFEQEAQPALVAPPFTAISLVDGLALHLSSPQGQVEEGSERREVDALSTSPPRGIDVNFSVSEPVWEVIKGDKFFQNYIC